MPFGRRLIAITILPFMLILWSSPVRANDQGAIRELMRSMFDRPESRLEIDPVVVVSGVAIAGWTQGDTGGRALLRRKSKEWDIVLCSGDELKTVEALRSAGIDEKQAKVLSAALAKAESMTDGARLRKFSAFEGTVLVGGQSPGPTHGPRH